MMSVGEWLQQQTKKLKTNNGFTAPLTNGINRVANSTLTKTTPQPAIDFQALYLAEQAKNQRLEQEVEQLKSSPRVSKALTKEEYLTLMSDYGISTLTEMAKVIGVSSQTIKKHLKKAGIRIEKITEKFSVILTDEQWDNRQANPEVMADKSRRYMLPKGDDEYEEAA